MVLIPYFAIRVLNEALGEGTLARMFFVERQYVPRQRGSRIGPVAPGAELE